MFVKLWFSLWNNFEKSKLCKNNFRAPFWETIYLIVGRCIFFPPIYLVLVSAIAVLLGEIVLPINNFSDWPKTLRKVDNLESKDTIRVFFLGTVALLDDNSLLQWDVDRFLADSYSRAIDLVKPDIIIAFGDIFPSVAPISRESADETLLRFSQIFRVRETVTQKRIPFSIILGGLDNSFLSGACKPECSEFVRNFKRLKMISETCQFYANSSILVRYFNSPFDSLDDPQCVSDKSGFIRVVAQHDPILPPMFAMFRQYAPSPVINYPLEPNLLRIVRDYAPQLVVTSGGGLSGIIFCTNCMSIAAQQPFFPQIEWLAITPGSEPVTFRMPSPVDGGGRGGSQPHICLPVATYSANDGFGNKRSYDESGYAFGIIDRSNSKITYFVLWNYNRALVIKYYTWLLYIAIFRFVVFVFLKTYCHFRKR